MITQIGEDASDGFGVVEPAAPDHAVELGGTEGVHGDGFVRFGLGGTGREAVRGEDQHALGEKAGRREKIEELAEAPGAVAGFFEEFAASGGDGALAGFDAARDELPEMAAGGMAVLPDEDNAPAGKNGEKNDRAVVDDDVAGDRDAAGFDDAFAANVEDGAAEKDFA